MALERLFAMTARGAALINRVKADPSLQDVEIRVLAHDSDYTRVVPRARAAAAAALASAGLVPQHFGPLVELVTPRLRAAD
jgi:hypothetical protein